MASWSRDKVDSSNINGGNEYTKGSRVSRQNLNAMVNSGLYSQDFAEHLADTPDTTNAGNVGTPSVSFVDNVVGGKTYKKFKFQNLKGATGATGNGIASVSKTSTSGLTDTYTITFTNGNTTTFTVKNGDSVDMRVDSGYFQWKRTQDSTWTNLIAVSAIAQVDQSLDSSSTNAIANSAVTNKFATTLQLPATSPSTSKFVTIDTSNTQNLVSLYQHNIVIRSKPAIISALSLKYWITLTVMSSRSSSYSLESLLSDKPSTNNVYGTLERNGQQYYVRNITRTSEGVTYKCRILSSYYDSANATYQDYDDNSRAYDDFYFSDTVTQIV